MTERKARHARPQPVPEDESGAAPEFLPGPPSAAMPEATSDGTPGAAPEATPGATSGAASEATPGATSGAASEATPGATSGAAPGAADWAQEAPGGYRTEPPGTPTVRGSYRPDIDIGSIHRREPGALRARLANDPRMPAWIWRAAAAAAVGTIISVLVDWRFGLTAAVIVAIADTIHRAQTTAAIPAAVRAPSAHRRTRRRLARLGRAGYRALHARAVPGSLCIIDHLVIGPGGVYAVDSERWDRRMPVRTSKGGKLYHGPFSQADRLAHAAQAADEAGRVVSAALGRDIEVQPAMAIYGPSILWTVASVGGVDVLSGRRLRKYLSQHAKARADQRLDSSEIERIYAAAAHSLPPAQ
jgi:hypothetical protein